jgi:hypothetical protein
MSNIFKFYINRNNNLSELYLFIKNKYFIYNTSKSSEGLLSVKELNARYSIGGDFLQSNVFNTFFTEDFNEYDIYYLQTFNPKIIFVDENIYNDDTIESIKLKFLSAFNSNVETFNKICFEELYFYGFVEKEFNIIEFYNVLTNNGQTSLTREKLLNYLDNIHERSQILEFLDIKDVYEYDDLLKINLKNSTIKYIKSIGQNFINNKLDYTYISNPFNVSNYDPLLKRLLDYIGTNNINLLFEYNLLGNSIYVCLFNDVNNYMSSKNLEEEITIKLYYNFLYNNNIINYENYTTNKLELIKKSDELISKTTLINKNNFVDLLNEIYYKSAKLDYREFGIRNINFNIYSNLNSNISLESIFKLINSNINLPIIKYNPGKKLENIYRLYCDKTVNNKKIPYLNKATILKYVKFMGKTNTISMLVNNNNPEFSTNISEFIVEIENNGIINIKIDFKKILDLETVNNIIKENLNPIILNIKKNVLNENIKLFENLLDVNNEINSLNYVINLNLKNNLNFKVIKNCLTYLFNIINDDSKVEQQLRYKRVSSYNPMNAEDAFILELIKQKLNEADILLKIQENLKVSQQDARTKLVTIVNSLQMVQNIFQYKKLKIKSNPGFLIKFRKETSNLIISIDNIDNIYYLDYIPMYLDSIVKLSSKFTLETEISDKVTKLCKKTSETIEESFIKDIDPEKITKDLQDTTDLNAINIDSINEELEADDEPNEDLLNILLDDSDDDDDDDDVEDDDDDGDRDVDSDTEEIQIDEEEEGAEQEEEEHEEVEHEEAEQEHEEAEEGAEAEETNQKRKVNQKKTNKSKDLEQRRDREQRQQLDREERQELDGEDEDNKFKEMSEKSNPILKRLISKEPALFSTDKNKFYTEYSRLCPSNFKKQPVVLTKQEKDYIDTHHKNSYTESYEYGTKEGEKYYYICPRYWDLEKNISLTHEEATSGNFGNIITKKNKDGTFDGNIMEFTDKKYHFDEKGNYVDHVPGFLDEKHNRNGFCLPCCFNNKLWNKPQQQLRRNKCLNLDTKIESVNKKEFFNYIKNPEKFPLEKNKIGFLPISIQKFLQFDNTNCITKQNTNVLKTNYSCLLRYGVENSKNQSFIACIADLYSTLVLNNTKIVSIKEMKSIIINAVNIDRFVVYNNGNLPGIFLSKNIDDKLLDSINIDKYKSSDLYKNFVDKLESTPDLSSEVVSEKYKHKLKLLKKIVNSYENFINYLNSDDYVIDYTYLWDILCKSNTLLFPNGLNLIILDITSEDITDNVKVICPKQNYSSEIFDDKKKCLILLKKYNTFEPIYLIKDSIEYYIKKVFKFNENIEDPQFRQFLVILNKLKTSINEKCISQLHNKNYADSDYTFKKNIELNKLLNILTELKYEINYQIMDYNNKIVGVIATKNLTSGFIPCYPSALDTIYNIPYKFFDDDFTESRDQDSISYFNDYYNTKEFLNNVYRESKERIVVKPLFKIVEDKTVVGIVTLGNQFVMLDKPEMDIVNDELEIINDKNYLYIDKSIQTSQEKDTERNKMINNIKLETSFYSSFKNTFKNILSKHKFISKKNLLLSIISDNTILFLDKLNKIYNILREIGENYFVFANYDERIIENIKKVSLCANEDECNTDFCMKSEKGCLLIIPETNLITNVPNEELYYTQLADEFIRYNKFKSFVFENHNTFSFGSIKYNILKNELLIFQLSLTQDYFNNIDNIKIDYSNMNNTYDTYSKNLIVNDPINLADVIIPKKVKVKPVPIEKIKIKLDDKKIQQIKDMTKNKEELQESGDEESGDEELKDVGQAEQVRDVEEVLDDVDDLERQADEEDDEYDILQNMSIINYLDNSIECTYMKNAVKEAFKGNFNKELHELYFPIENKNCTYQIFLLILKHHNQTNTLYKDYNINSIKNKLIEIYSTSNYKKALFYILYKNNKKTIMENVLDESIKFEDLVYSDDYYLTYIDIYLLSKEFDLPIVLLCNTIIDINITFENFIICNLNKTNNNYYFIKVSSIYSRDKVPNNKLLYLKESILINIDDHIVDTQKHDLQTKLIKNLKLYNNVLEKYIVNYDLEKVTKSKYVKPNKPIKINKQFMGREEVLEAEPEPELEPEVEARPEPILKQQEESKSKKAKKKRCPNGSRRNPSTGECEPV